MSRWSQKSDEEKAQAAKNLKENKEKHIPKWEQAQKDDDNKKVEFMKQGLLPLKCKKCGTTTTKHYTLCMMKYPFGSKPVQVAYGECITCGGPARAIIDLGTIGLDMAMMVGQVIMVLKSRGRITDDRNGQVREWK